jgi:PAS domain S-box-containing protein
VDRTTRRPTENPIDRVIREGRVMHLQDPVLLIARDGAERAITQSAAPIQGDSGSVMGVALVIHDVTERELGDSALRASQEMFRIISDNVSDLIAVLDTEGRRLYASRSYSRHFPGKDFYLTSAFDELHPDDDARVRGIFAEMLRTGKTQRAEFRLVRADGSILFLESDASVIATPDGSAPKILVVSRDITERHDAAEQVNRQLRFTETLVNSMPGLFYLYDARRKIIRWNKTFETVTGYSAAEIDVLDPLAYFPESERPRVHDRMLQCFAEGSSDIEVRLLSKSGRISPYFVTGLRIDVDGRPCMLGIGIDISARLAAEDSLRATMRRLERQNNVLSEQARSPALLSGDIEDSLRAIAELAARTLDCARTSIWFYNANRTHLRCAHLFDRETGRHSMGLEVAARDYPLYFAALDEERAIAANTALTDARTRELAPTYLIPFGISSLLDAPIRSDGRMVGVVCQEHVGPARTWQADEQNFAGSVADLVSLSIEVAQRRQAEAALREAHDSLEIKVADRTRDLAAANERLKELDRLKSEFLATMSHELRTPLNSIIGFTGILRQELAGPLNEEQKKQLGMVHFSARHLLGLINDLLDLSRIESGKMELTREDFTVSDVVNEVVQSMTPQATQKNLALETELAEPALLLHSDRKKCFQILLNLVNNAVKFTERGRVCIAVRTTPEDVEFAVTDTGIGIKPESMAHLFEAFRQVDGSARRVYEGTGLGLYLCRQLASMLDGRISAESEFGHGSRFTFTLPRHPPATKSR